MSDVFLRRFVSLRLAVDKIENLSLLDDYRRWPEHGRKSGCSHWDAFCGRRLASVNGGSFAPNAVTLLTIEALLSGTHWAEHPGYEPDLNFKKAEKDAEQQSLI